MPWTKVRRQKNVLFHAYAKHRIKGAILDSLRQLDWASRDLRRRQKQVEAPTRDLAAKLGRTPHDTEVADQWASAGALASSMQMEVRTAGLGLRHAGPEDDRDRTQDFAATAGIPARPHVRTPPAAAHARRRDRYTPRALSEEWSSSTTPTT